MDLRFHIDPETGLPHIHDHGVAEHEVEEVLRRPSERWHGSENTRIAIGQTQAGRYLQVVYVPDEEGVGVFVITAYQLRGKPLIAYRRRRRKRKR
jgi:hypothetical protein